jgi:signal transduction histidine kinase
VFIYFRKFTENRIISNELSIRNKELEKLSESKSKFFTLISHDLKAPLYNVSNLSNLLKLYRYDMDEKEKDETLNQLNLSSKHLVNLVDNILLWASAQIGNLENEPEKLWLDSIISESMDLLAPMAKEKGINMNYEQNNIYVIADYNLLSTSIRNLMSNAVKFSNSNSTITISATQNNEYVDINVKDEGIGIESDRLERILSGNYISDLGTNNEKGSGLGLKITKEFIELNGGILTGESIPNKGSNFIIRLPKR